MFEEPQTSPSAAFKPVSSLLDMLGRNSYGEEVGHNAQSKAKSLSSKEASRTHRTRNESKESIV